MHIVFVSNCESKAIKKTRAIIDRYATRIADRTWASPFTMEALDEVHHALKRVATRQTSVACYRNNGRDGLKLDWIVGNKHAYDSLGAYAIETKSKKKEFPLYLRHAALVAQASGLGHDFGKANRKFASKLLSTERTVADKVRHEWISAWLMQHMDGNFSVESLKVAWAAWSTGGVREVVNTDKNKIWLPVNSIDTAYDAMTFCVATHHRLLGYSGYHGVTPPENHGIDRHVNDVSPQSDISICTIADWKPWESIMEQLASKYERIKVIQGNPDYWRGVSLIARACLVLADHEVSSQQYGKKSNTDTWANSMRVKGTAVYNQPLTYHLEHVGRYAASNIAMFSGSDLPSLSLETRKNIEAPAIGKENVDKYCWQDEAFNFMRDRASKGPSLIFNVAGTGSGKTLGNIKILAALNPNDLRITAGFNLRTLTLQTRDAYAAQVGLKEDEIGCIVGGANNIIEKIHSFSLDDDEDRVEVSEWNVKAAAREDLPDWLVNFHSNTNKDHCLKLIGTPVIVTTMDHLIEAGEPGKQAGHALAMIRISSSDLIIDEADSYDPGSLMAVLRVIEITAMFGRNIVISSATLPAVLADAISKAWRSGNNMCKALRNTGDGHIYCVSNKSEPIELNFDGFSDGYEFYIKQIAANVAASEVTKIFRIVAPASPDEYTKNGLINRITTSIEGLHKSNHQQAGNKTVSIGLVRVANVAPCIEIANKLASLNRDADIYVMTYHAREILARRAWKEKVLDLMLSRKPDANGIDPDWWDRPSCEEIKKIIESSTKSEVIFVVVATPVAEVGRDHDYDWGVLEPSSMTSIIQAGGRVNRHRLKPVYKPNIHILDINFAYVMQAGKKDKRNCYTKPGHQIKTDKLHTHALDGNSMSVSSLFGMPLKDARTEQKEMDVRLIFGEAKVLFSSEDDKGITTTINGAMQATGNQKSWINGWIYDNFKLRENNTQTDFIYNFETKKTQKIVFSDDPREKNISKKRKPRPENTSVIEELTDLASKTFFSPNLDYINEWLIEKNVLPEDMAALGSFSVDEKDTDPTITTFGVSF